MNILVYNDLGASPSSVKHTVNTLKSILGHAYDVIEIDRRVLQSEPWEVGCVMLVMPGGRDMPYCEALNGEPNARIQRFVQGGGRYLGICAGAYYASASIEFEKGRALMEIIQERELGFYPGLSRGTAYPGFVYNSESGARSVTVSLCKDTLKEYYGTDVPQEISMYYNGGGYFVDPHYDHVTVLCRYKDLDAAAVVHCRVGMGHALLIGTHPEYDVGSDDLLSIDEHISQSVRKILDDLVLSEVERKRFLRAAFAQIGLNVVPLNSSIVQENIIPNPTPIYITGLTKEWVQKPVSYLLKKSNPVTHIIEDKDDVFCILLMEEQANKQVQLLSMCRVKEEKAPVIQLVYQSTINAVEPIYPPLSMTPHFNMQTYYDYLVKKRALQWGGGGWLKFGNGVMYAEVMSSTQSILEKNYKFPEAFPSGFVCLASNQIAGRGRGRNSWVSQSGALQFSMVLRHSLHFRNAPVVFMQYIVALAVVESIRSRPGYEHIPLRLKWPNDIYAETKQGLKKVGGLLINSSFVDNDFVLVIGCGINLSNTNPTVSINEIIQDCDALPLGPEDTLSGILVKFETLYNEFCEKGMGHWFLSQYYQRWLHNNAVVSLTTHNNEMVKIIGITSDYGMLKAESIEKPGKFYGLLPDGNSFDMMRGLLVQKKQPAQKMSVTLD